MNKKITDKDRKDLEDFIGKKEKLPNKDSKYYKKKNFKTSSIDLHGFSIEQANQVVKKFILKSYEENTHRLIIVTGKGLHSQNEKNPYVSRDLSILKYSVPQFILSNKNLMSIINEIQDAKIEDGGSGAFYIFLKQKKS